MMPTTREHTFPTERKGDTKMRKRTYTIFTDADVVYGYLFDVTSEEANATIKLINEETGEHHYLMDGYHE